jgi:chemotaxis protein methyltransferase CheR
MSSIGAADIERFRDLLTRRFGLSLEGRRQADVAAVLAERVAASARSCAAYLDDLAAGASAAELGALAAAVTVPETYFFRGPEQFRALAEVAVPDRMRARATTRRLRLLSMACATGEETYSLAMAVRDAVTEPGWEVDVLGVDLNPTALDTAVRGRYPDWSLRAMPPLLQRRWLRPDDPMVRVVDEARRRVRFLPGNLTDPDAAAWQVPDGYDVIFCRNVLMYLTPRHARAAVARLVGSLAPGGYLFLGHAETAYGRTADVELRHTHHTFYFQRPRVDAVPEVPVPNRKPNVVSPVRRTAPRSVPTRERLLALMRQERFGEALALCEEAGTPDAGTDALLHGVLLAQCGLLARAEAECRRLLDADGFDAGAHYLLAVCREGAGDGAAAEHHARTAAYLDPGFALPRLRLGQFARRRGDVRTARAEFGSALTLLAGEDPDRVLLFGGGFTMPALIDLCRREIRGCGSVA